MSKETYLIKVSKEAFVQYVLYLYLIIYNVFNENAYVDGNTL